MQPQQGCSRPDSESGRNAGTPAERRDYNTNPPHDHVAKLRSKLRIAKRFHGVHPSLVDVMLSLIFMYMLSSLMVAAYQGAKQQERALPPVHLAELPDPNGAANPAPRQTTVVTVGSKADYTVDDKPVTLDRLEQMFKTRPPQEVEVRGDEAVNYGAIMNVMRVCRQAGISRVALVYKPKE
jgi:biopolymer transport protein ExbD